MMTPLRRGNRFTWGEDNQNGSHLPVVTDIILTLPGTLKSKSTIFPPCVPGERPTIMLSWAIGWHS